MKIGHTSDERGSLAKVPELFRELLDAEEDPLVAVRTVFALMSGDGGSSTSA